MSSCEQMRSPPTACAIPCMRLREGVHVPRKPHVIAEGSISIANGLLHQLGRLLQFSKSLMMLPTMSSLAASSQGA